MASVGCGAGVPSRALQSPSLGSSMHLKEKDVIFQTEWTQSLAVSPAYTEACAHTPSGKCGSDTCCSSGFRAGCVPRAQEDLSGPRHRCWPWRTACAVQQSGSDARCALKSLKGTGSPLGQRAIQCQVSSRTQRKAFHDQSFNKAKWASQGNVKTQPEKRSILKGTIKT